MRRRLLLVSIVLVLSGPGGIAAAAPDHRRDNSSLTTPAIENPAGALTPLELPDGLAMVLAGTALIGAAAAVRRGV
jgi:hypothetical protein